MNERGPREQTMRTIRFAAAAVLTLAAGCGDDGGESADTSSDTGGDGVAETSPETGVGPEVDTFDAGAETSPDVDVTPTPDACEDPIPAPPAGELCAVTDGSDRALLIRADLVLPDGLLERGALLIEDGMISCAGCDCLERPAAADATVFACPEVVVSPGLINAHDHVTFAQDGPQSHGDVRYDHRQEWRNNSGVNPPGKPKLGAPRNTNRYGDSWVELRQVFGGATSYFASGAAPGLVRNLDIRSRMEGLEHDFVDTDPFPFGREGLVGDNCEAEEIPSEGVLGALAYVPHVAEGINRAARNEQICLDGQAAGGVDVVEDNTAFIHGVGTTAGDIAIFTGEGAGLIWSPRTNTDLYGHTAQAPLYHRLGGRIGLGTDWTNSGSMNMLRELECADAWNQRWNGYFSDADLVKMATSWGAAVLHFDDVLGSIAPGMVADVTLWDARDNSGYRAIIDAEVGDVVLVLRGGSPPVIDGQTYFRRGRPLYGEPSLVTTLSDRELDYAKYDPNVYSPTDPGKKKLEPCETIDVCGRQKVLCLAEQMEDKPDDATYFQTFTFAELEAQLDPERTYGAFFCGTPPGEPTCVPSRPGEFDGIGDAADADGDGIDDADDKCPGWFSAIRLLDNGIQPDTDGDGVGDICDVCPFDADTEACTSVDPDDIDGDGVVNERDVCPNLPDDQSDGDGDGIGDACDACPDFANTDGRGCPTTIMAIKQGDVTLGSPVSLNGVVVVAVAPDFYTVQNPGPAQEYGGLYVFTGTGGEKPEAGQLIILSGSVDDYFGQIQLRPMAFEVLPSPGEIPEPLVISPADVAQGGAKEKAYEGLLVEVRDVVVTDASPEPQVDGPSTENVDGEFVVTGGMRVDTELAPLESPPYEGEELAVVRGILRFAWNRDKLVLRSPDDIVRGAPRLAGFSEDAVELYAESTLDIDLALTRAPDEEVHIVLTSDDPSVATVPDYGVFELGAAITSVPISGVKEGSTTITASYDGDRVELAVTVYAAEAEPKVVALSADPESIVVGGRAATVTVTLDLPGRPDGTQVQLSPSGASLVLPARSVRVPFGARSVGFEVTSTDEAGIATLTASAGGGEASVDIEIREQPEVGPLLVEVLYNASGADDGMEWVKLYNGSDGELNLAGYSLGWRGQSYENGGGKLDLSGSVGARSCIIIGGPTPNFGITEYGIPFDFEPDIQNAGSGPSEALDGVSLYDVSADEVTEETPPIDIVAWGAVNTHGLMGPDGLLEAANAPVVNGESVRRESLTTWVAATPSADCVVITD